MDDQELLILFNEEQVAQAVRRLAGLLTEEYRDRNPVVVGVLKGAFIFMADLVRHLNFPFEIDFVCVSTYGNKTAPAVKPTISKNPSINLKGRHVIIVEDIVDTGITMAYVTEKLTEAGAASVKVCTLLDKRARRKVRFEPHYTGFCVDDSFIVGYGIDYAEKYRSLRGIYCIKKDCSKS